MVKFVPCCGQKWAWTLVMSLDLIILLPRLWSVLAINQPECKIWPYLYIVKNELIFFSKAIFHKFLYKFLKSQLSANCTKVITIVNKHEEEGIV